MSKKPIVYKNDEPNPEIVVLFRGDKPKQVLDSEWNKNDIYACVRNAKLVARTAFLRSKRITFSHIVGTWMINKNKSYYKTFKYNICLSFNSGQLKVYFSGYDVLSYVSNSFKEYDSQSFPKKYGIHDITGKSFHKLVSKLTVGEIELIERWAKERNLPLDNVSKYMDKDTEKEFNTLKQVKLDTIGLKQTELFFAIRKIAFPILADAKFITRVHDDLPFQITRGCRSGRLRDFAKLVFGNHGKLSMKACTRMLNKNDMNKGKEYLLLCFYLKNIIPHEDLINFVNNHIDTYRLYDISEDDALIFKNLALYLRPHTLLQKRTLLESFIMDNHYEIRDTLKMWEDLNHPYVNAKTFPEAHDILIKEHRLLKIQDYAIPPKFNPIKSDDLYIVPLTSNYMGMDWGREMHHCIASYCDWARKGLVTVGGVYQKDKLIANFSIKNTKLEQLLGPYNRSLPTDLHNKIINILYDNQVCYKTMGHSMLDRREYAY